MGEGSPSAQALGTKVNVKSRAARLSAGPHLPRAHSNFHVAAAGTDLSGSTRNRCWFLDSNLQGSRVYEYWNVYDIYLIVPGMGLTSDYSFSVFGTENVFFVFYVSGSQTAVCIRTI